MKITINKLHDGYFGIRSNFVEREDCEVTVIRWKYDEDLQQEVEDGRDFYLVKRGTKPHRISKIPSKFEEKPMTIYMYKAPVIASLENQMRLF